ncbi:MAG: type III pantothenate kinase, partial [Acetatifactor sp.]|nr:type III pantothenate kinase [Acetatifactor sp.]
MILVVDVGNTNITCGVYGEREMKATFRMTTKTPRTSDEYGVMMTQMLAARGVKAQAIEGMAVASVVPDVMHSLMGGITRYVTSQVLTVGPGTKTGIK